jgi:hypothetical protein
LFSSYNEQSRITETKEAYEAAAYMKEYGLMLRFVSGNLRLKLLLSFVADLQANRWECKTDWC